MIVPQRGFDKAAVGGAPRVKYVPNGAVYLHCPQSEADASEILAAMTFLYQNNQSLDSIIDHIHVSFCHRI